MEKIKVMIAGYPGKMASAVAIRVISTNDLYLVTSVLARNYGGYSYVDEEYKYAVKLIHLESHKNVILEERPDIIVDFTNPGSVNTNAELYCECQIPFVMGTTGGDRDFLVKTVKKSNISAVIAPNMAKQIVTFQAMMEYAAKTFPNVFKDYQLVITESHQKGKADTSGTAKAMVQYFNDLGIPFKKEQIIMIRDPIMQQVKLGVPMKYLDGHGWHTYTLLSERGTVFFQFTHNVNGRDVYAEGTIDAIRFLSANKQPGKVFSMIDVLKG